MTSRQLLNVGKSSFRVGTWHADDRTAYMAVQPRSGEPSVEGLRSCLGRLADAGYSSVITSALHPQEARNFKAVGFEEYDRLNVLAHDLHDLDRTATVSPEGVRLRRARHRDRDGALVVDGRAFPDFWRLDRAALTEAERATPSHRFRVAVEAGAHDGIAAGRPTVVAYAITGRGGGQGFLQRLATDPAVAGRGIGSALVFDALRWALRRGARRVLVNTQVTNERALELYRRAGFHTTPTDLVVLRRPVP